jgi:hypothetical protein
MVNPSTRWIVIIFKNSRLKEIVTLTLNNGPSQGHQRNGCGYLKDVLKINLQPRKIILDHKGDVLYPAHSVEIDLKKRIKYIKNSLNKFVRELL